MIVQDKKIYICCPKNKRQVYKSKLKNYYIDKVLYTDDLDEADMLLYIADGKFKAPELTIAQKRNIPIQKVEKNMINRQLMTALIYNTLYQHEHGYSMECER